MAAAVRELVVAEEIHRRAVAAALAVTPVEATALEFLLHHGARPPSLIAARTGLSRTSTTALVDRLAAAGWVSRRPHLQDRRSVLVELTDLGFAVALAAHRVFVADVEAALDRADPRLRDDPGWRRAVGGFVALTAAALRRRAGDVLGVETALGPHVASSADQPDRR
ncbi:MarR family transcriptional regulator [Actinomycetospora sp. TBRC 11914]|nr:MarR family transcriptional regulator [Actinomycetospora sp. TBRC 11914]